MSEELHYLELLEVGRRIQTGTLSSVEVTRALLSRIEKLDPQLRAYVRYMPDQALAQARRADEEIAAGNARGPLHGVPVAVKDLFWSEGTPSSHGMAILKDFVPSRDATVVRRLKEAGAVLLGKLQQTEGAFAEHHPHFQTPINPWGNGLWPGVSSSGSGVATAAGLCYGSLGTDTGGSIRFPSGANGVTGIKPTWGRVSRFGAHELAASMDHVGPIARSAADAGAILAAIAGSDPLDPTAIHLGVPDYLATMTRGVRELRIGVDRSWADNQTDDATRTVQLAVSRAMQKLGVSVREISFPDTAQAVADWAPMCAIEAANAHESTFPARASEYGHSLADLLTTGRSLSAMDYQKMLLRREELTGRVRALFDSVDLLLIPCTAFAAITVERIAALQDDAELFAGMLRYTCPFNMTGNPTITLPGGQTATGAPVGFQFVAPHFAEHLLVQAGWAYQRETDWHKRRPLL